MCSGTYMAESMQCLVYSAVPASRSAQATNRPLKEGRAGPATPSQRLPAPKLYLEESGEEQSGKVLAKQWVKTSLH